MTAPDISIIIPSYQHAGEIAACLDSIFRQTFTDFEVIVVDDGSTDGTAEVVKPYLDRATYIRKENGGAPSARNRGFREAKGSYLLFCDADIIMEPQCLEKMRASLDAHPEAAYAYVSFKFGFKTFRLWPFNPDLLRKMNYIHSTSLIRREAFPGWDESIRRLQDWDLWLTMLKNGYSGVWVPEVLFRAIPHKGGISTWVPGVFYRIPWDRIGIRIPTVEKYQIAERIVKKKHGLT